MQASAEINLSLKYNKLEQVMFDHLRCGRLCTPLNAALMTRGF